MFVMPGARDDLLETVVLGSNLGLKYFVKSQKMPASMAWWGLALLADDKIKSHH